MQTKTVLDVRDLSIIFKVNNHLSTIVKNCTFSIKEGETLGLVGESGSGKSVTALSIIGLLPRPPLHSVTGSVVFQSQELLTLKNNQLTKIRGKEIGFISQEPMTSLNPVLPVGKQLREVMTVHHVCPRDMIEEKSVELLREVGLSNPEYRLKNYPHELSGGMRQRVMIALALACNPKLLIADEPTTALDVTIQAQVLEVFKDLIEKRNMSVLFISHDLGVIAEIADSVLVMKHGASVEYDDITAVYSHPRHPYTQELLTLHRKGVLQ